MGTSSWAPSGVSSSFHYNDFFLVHCFGLCISMSLRQGSMCPKVTSKNIFLHCVCVCICMCVCTCVCVLCMYAHVHVHNGYACPCVCVLCMYAYMWAYVGGTIILCVSGHVVAKVDVRNHPSLLFSSVVQAGSAFQWTQNLPIWLLSVAACSRESPSLLSKAGSSGICHSRHTDIYMGSEDSNSQPHICTPNA